MKPSDFHFLGFRDINCLHGLQLRTWRASPGGYVPQWQRVPVILPGIKFPFSPPPTAFRTAVEILQTLPNPVAVNPVRNIKNYVFWTVRISGYRSRGPVFDSRHYQIFWEVMGLDRGQLGLVSTIEELLGRTRSGFGRGNRECDLGDPPLWPRDTLYPQKLTLTSPTSGGRSVGIILSRTEATELVLVISQLSIYFKKSHGV
jgi:hypothetical protein